MVLNWFVESEEVFMLQMVSPLILKLSLFLVTAVATHLVMRGFNFPAHRNLRVSEGVENLLR